MGGRGPVKRSKPERYPIMVQEMDKGVGEILDALQAEGIAGNTLVFFSDNGPSGQGSAGPLRGNKGKPWEGGHRVPTIAWWPGKIVAGKTTDHLGISLDLMPTMLELAGASVPEGHKLDGVSLCPVLLEGKSTTARPLFWGGRGVRVGKWKIAFNELYDLQADIGETTDLSEQYPERFEAMKKAFNAWAEDVGAERRYKL